MATVTDQAGSPLRGVTVTIERAGTAFRILETDRAGRVSLSSVPVGRYAILAEQLGYQPVRALDARVVAGAVTSLSIRLERRPPPINTVTEQAANATVTGSTSGEVIDRGSLLRFDRQRDLSDALRNTSSVGVPVDGRSGMLLTAGGLAASHSRLMVDGVEETLLRHPGIPDEAATTPLWSRDALSQAVVSFLPEDIEFRLTSGALVSATSLRGDAAFRARSYAAFSGAKLGGAKADNPADSAASSFELGVALSGGLKSDTVTWALHADYRQLERPTADPFVAGSTNPGPAIESAAQALSGTDVSAWLSPTVRTWKGGSAGGRLDWMLGAHSDLAIRAGGASWSEDNPQVGREPVNGAGARLEAKDFSSSAALGVSGDEWRSETRLGLRTAQRNWFAASLPYTGFVGEGFAIGGASTLPGNFKETAFELNQAVTIHSGLHTLKLGGNAQRRNVTYDWMPGSAGRFEFGDVVAGFSTGTGAFYQAVRAGDAPKIGVTTISLFLQDSWQASSALQFNGGVRFQRVSLPTNLIENDEIWGAASGANNNLVPERQKQFGPEGGFSYRAGSSGRTVLHGQAAVLPGAHDLGTFAEVAQYDGDVSVRRATGVLNWPRVGQLGNAPFVGPSITFYSPSVRAPKTAKFELGLSNDLGSGTTLSLTGSYGHSDYLLRREDANRSVAPLSTSSDGRSIWGSLEQYGAMLTPAVGSNRRFQEIDFAYGLTSTGYSDYYAATVQLQRSISRGLQLGVAYTYSKTNDNLVGQLSSDPADRLSPFADNRGAAGWDAGRSDLDIPHRLVATAEYRSGGANPYSLAARYRFRSGLPFTPGFQRGVDANGDGSSSNDPAFLGGSISGLSELVGRESCLSGAGFAVRNSCRDKGVHAFDLRGEIGLPIGGRSRVALTVDAFNLVGSETGRFDHAAVLVNPAGDITIDAAGRTVLPLVANSNFGKLLGRGGDGRLLRVGIRVEN
ncbi:MAG: carboxypeptidase-like regulatory domain-containing protein [Gemmatimonadota bacterium]